MASDQKQLHLLVRWCQVIGLSPFRMEEDPESGRFQRFAFSWRHPLTWWWFAFKVFYLALTLVWVAQNWQLVSLMAESENYSTTTKLLNQVSIINLTLAQFIFPEVVAYRYSLLARISRRLRRTDELLADYSCPSCTTRKRSVIGIVFTCMMSLVCPICMSGSVQDKSEIFGLAAAVLHAAVLVGACMRICTFVLIFHSSYYSMSHRIECLTHRLTQTAVVGPFSVSSSKRKTFTLPKKSLRWTENRDVNIKLVHEVFDRLCRTLDCLNQVFSIFCLFFFVEGISLIIYFSHQFIINLMRPPEESFNNFLIFWLLIWILWFAVIIHSADLPKQQVRKLRQRLMKLSHRDLVESEKNQLYAFSMLATDERVVLSAGGVFNVGMHLLPSMSASVITYLVILQQSF